MLNFETTVQDSKSYGDLTLSEVEPILKINLRSNKREFSTKIGKLLSIIPPIEAVSYTHLTLPTKRIV